MTAGFAFFHQGRKLNESRLIMERLITRLVPNRLVNSTKIFSAWAREFAIFTPRPPQVPAAFRIQGKRCPLLQDLRSSAVLMTHVSGTRTPSSIGRAHV